MVLVSVRQNHFFYLVNVYTQGMNVPHQDTALAPYVKEHFSLTRSYVKGITLPTFQALVWQYAVVVNIHDLDLHLGHHWSSSLMFTYKNCAAFSARLYIDVISWQD